MKTNARLRSRCMASSASAIFAGVLATLSLSHAVDYTWTSTATGTLSWTDTTRWSGGTVFSSGSGNALIFDAVYVNGSRSITTNVPTTLSLNTLTLGGSANAVNTATVTIASTSSTWTIGDGITSVINLTGNYNSTRSLTYNLAANISLNQAITTFTGNGTGHECPVVTIGVSIG